MSGVELPLDDLETPIDELCVSDEEKQALIVLDDFISAWSKAQKFPQNVEIKEVEKALDSLLLHIRQEMKKIVTARNKHLDVIADKAGYAFFILAKEKVSAAKCFQYALWHYLAMKKQLDPNARLKLKSGKIDWTIAHGLVSHAMLTINGVYKMMQEAHEMAIKEGNEVMSQKIKDALLHVSKERENEGISLNEWSDRFLDYMVKSLRSCGLGKVYREGFAIFIQLGDAAYKPTAFHDSDSPVVDGRVTKDEYLRTIVESVTYNAMFEITQPPSELKISAQITSLSEHLKKIEFIPS